MLILSFLVPVLLWLLAIAVYGIFPFGEYTLLTSDMFFQYTYFFEFYQRVLQEGIDIFYSFAYGVGLWQENYQKFHPKKAIFGQRLPKGCNFCSTGSESALSCEQQCFF